MNTAAVKQHSAIYINVNPDVENTEKEKEVFFVFKSPTTQFHLRTLTCNNRTENRKLKQVARLVLLEGVFGRRNACDEYICFLMFLAIFD